MRNPTVSITHENQAHLKTFPRPRNDNGRGMHFGLDLRDGALDEYVPRLVELGVKWTLVYAGDELQAERAARALWSHGIMPIIRPQCRIDGAAVAWSKYVNALTRNGIPAYIQVFNEPGDPREWRTIPDNYLSVFAPKWEGAARAVVEAGGFPGLQVMGKEEFDAVVARVPRTDALWQKTWFALHNYGANHPPAYPYDARHQQDHPGDTILDDDISVLNFLAIAKWMQDGLGFVMPMIGGEGGWQYNAREDNRYPAVAVTLHAQYHRAMFEWFRTGVVSNDEPLPDYLFSVAPWILFGWGSDDWYGGSAGTKTQTLDAVKAIPAFTRKFAWDTPPALDQFVQTEARKYTWMPINTDAALYKFAQANKLGYPQTDEFEFTHNGAGYLGQVFNLGIVYVKKGDWGNVKWMKKP